MFKKGALFLGVLSILLFLGCTKKSPTDPDREDLSSSSGDVISSSSSVSSSSSIDDSKIPEGARRATLSDMPTNISLGKLLGGDAYMVAGKNGLFSIWFFEEGETTEDKSHGWIVANSNFENGIIKLENPQAAAAYANTTMGAAIRAMVDSITTLSFIVKDTVILYSINDGEYASANKIAFALQPAYHHKASDIYNVKLSCGIGKNAFSLKFFSDGRFIKESSGDTNFWSAGLFDIHRSNLLLRPTYYNAPVNALFKYKVDSETFALDTITCAKTSFESKAWDKKDIIKTWVAKDSLNWVLTFNASGSFDLVAEQKSVAKERKTGIWDRIGSYLVLKTSTCLDPKTCSNAILGEIIGLEENFFTYDHVDIAKPLLPTDWDIAVYEE